MLHWTRYVGQEGISAPSLLECIDHNMCFGSRSTQPQLYSFYKHYSLVEHSVRAAVAQHGMRQHTTSRRLKRSSSRPCKLLLQRAAAVTAANSSAWRLACEDSWASVCVAPTVVTIHLHVHTRYDSSGAQAAVLGTVP